MGAHGMEAQGHPLTIVPTEQQQDCPPDHGPGEHIHQGGPRPEECNQGPHGTQEQTEPPTGDTGPVSSQGVWKGDLSNLGWGASKGGILKHAGFSPTGGSHSSRRSQNSPPCYTPAAAFPPASTTPCHPTRASQARPPTASPPAPPHPAAAQLLMPQQVGAPRAAQEESRQMGG